MSEDRDTLETHQNIIYLTCWFSIILCWTVSQIYTRNTYTSRHVSVTRRISKKTSNKTPLILVTSHWGPIWPPRNIDLCPVEKRCLLTDKVNFKNFKNADMVIFHFNRIPPFQDNEMKLKNFTEKFSFGRNGQKSYTFLSWESPHYHRKDYTKQNNWFNFTMSYRLDSDFPLPYGTVWSSKVRYKNKILKNLEKLRGY